MLPHNCGSWASYGTIICMDSTLRICLQMITGSTTRWRQSHPMSPGWWVCFLSSTHVQNCLPSCRLTFAAAAWECTPGRVCLPGQSSQHWLGTPSATCTAKADTSCAWSSVHWQPAAVCCQDEKGKTTPTYACVHSGLCWWVPSPKRMVRRTLMPSLALQSRSGACHVALQGPKACQALPDFLVAVSRIPGAPYLSLMCRVCRTTMQTQCRVGCPAATQPEHGMPCYVLHTKSSSQCARVNI